MKAPTLTEYKRVFESKALSNRQIEILSFLFHAKNSSLTEAQLAKICSYRSKSSASFQIGKIGKIIASTLNFKPFEYVPGKPAYFSLVGPYTGENGWEMNSNLKIALKEYLDLKKTSIARGMRVAAVS